jgi:hypothetical protein
MVNIRSSGNHKLKQKDIPTYLLEWLKFKSLRIWNTGENVGAAGTLISITYNNAKMTH